jgi:pimeloyl-ACP methyl ester carboxylesterase
MRERRLRSLATLILAIVVAACSTTPPEPSPSASGGPSASAATSSAPSTGPSPSPSPAPAERPFPGGWTFVKEEPCPDESTYTCTTLAVPRDHFVQGGPTWEVTFAFRAASGQRRGTHVVATGGPGTSGIVEADGYVDEDYPSAVGERWDTIFFDQRGIGLSHPIQCPRATAVYYYATDYDPFEPDGARQAMDASRTYVQDCLAEAGADEADLPFYATRQAVEDLANFLDYKGIAKISLYGESYGSQYAQVFAASHPERIEALFLDGPVDLAQPGVDWMAEQARSFDDVLQMTLANCQQVEACAAEFAPSTPLAFFDDLQARLEDEPIEVQWPLSDGTSEARPITSAALDIAVGTITGPDDRMILQRVLAAAADDNLVPMAQLGYAYQTMDPDSLVGQLTPDWSDAMYYAVDCMDTRFPEAPTDDEEAAAILAAGDAQGVDDMRLDFYYATELPCAYWPSEPAGSDPADEPADVLYPTFVLGATGDPTTPVANVHRIAARLANAYSIIAEGGHHVIFGWGNDCPDQILAAWFEDGTLPASRTTVCPDTIVDSYIPVAAAASTDYPDALSFATSMDDQVNYQIGYWYWDGVDPLKVGCDRGGTLTYTPTDAGADLAFAGCAFTAGMPMTGSGAIDYEAGATSLTVEFPDGSLEYARDGDGNQTIAGTFRGQAVASSS